MDDWQVGDLALCINGSRLYVIRAGSVHTVAAVVTSRTGTLGLSFADVTNPPGKIGFIASAFKKIHPHTPDAEDITTIALMSDQRVPALAKCGRG